MRSLRAYSGLLSLCGVYAPIGASCFSRVSGHRESDRIMGCKLGDCQRDLVDVLVAAKHSHIYEHLGFIINKRG